MNSKEHMKYFTRLFLFSPLLFLLINFYCEGFVTGNVSTFELVADGLIRNSSKPCFIDVASYVNGGVTFTYPVGLFSTAPTIRVSLEGNTTAYSTSQVFVAEITTNSATSTTIRVNLVTTSTITEASNNEVTVHIFSIEI